MLHHKDATIDENLAHNRVARIEGHSAVPNGLELASAANGSVEEYIGETVSDAYRKCIEPELDASGEVDICVHRIGERLRKVETQAVADDDGSAGVQGSGRRRGNFHPVIEADRISADVVFQNCVRRRTEKQTVKSSLRWEIVDVCRTQDSNRGKSQGVALDGSDIGAPIGAVRPKAVSPSASPTLRIAGGKPGNGEGHIIAIAAGI